MAGFIGKYAFVSQDKFNEYLKSIGLSTLQVTVAVSDQPEIVIATEGDVISVTYVMKTKTIALQFVLDEKRELDMIGVGRPAFYINTQSENWLVSQNATDSDQRILMKFDDAGVVVHYINTGIEATRTFRRV